VLNAIIVSKQTEITILFVDARVEDSGYYKCSVPGVDEKGDRLLLVFCKSRFMF